MTETYRERLWTAWSHIPSPHMSDIPVARAQLIGRAGEFEPRTSTWLASLEKRGRATWRAVRDERTGHTIHCVSDRRVAELTADLRIGLRLMAWMSTRPYVWYWWDHEWPRVLPANTDPAPEHLNGGWAVPGVLEVHVYRREEAHKVMLHESVHALELDVPMDRIPAIRAQFERDLHRRLWPHLGECFTELYAEWLWSIASAQSLKEARGLWAAQLTCSERQAAMVWARILDAHDPETTNVFAYYVLKWVLMQHLEEALLQPTKTLTKWFPWWRTAKPQLTRMAQQVMYTEGVPMRMGMTCQADLKK
jgi:hypothetical protein